MTPRETFESLRAAGRAEHTALEAFFDALPPLDRTEMLGSFTGGVFGTGHRGEAQLVAMRWVGKDFHGVDDVDPIVVRGDDGVRAASPVLGKAQLRNVEFRGVVSATMIYDAHPILDHFRRIDDGLVLGCMDRKGDPTPLYFYLERLR